MWSNFSKDVVAYLAIAINRQRRVLLGIELGRWNSSEEEGSLFDSLSDSSSEGNSSIQLTAVGRGKCSVYSLTMMTSQMMTVAIAVMMRSASRCHLLPPPSGATSLDTPLPFQGVLLL